MLGDIIVAVIWLLSTVLCFDDFGGRGHFKSYWLPWLPNNKMQHHNNPLLVLRTLSGKFRAKCGMPTPKGV